MRISDRSSDVCSSDLIASLQTRIADAAGPRERARRPVIERRLQTSKLLELDRRASLFQLLLELFGLVLADAFLDGLRRAFDEILRLLEAEPGNGTHLFDDVDLLLAGRGQRSAEHTSELQSLMRTSYAAFVLHKKTTIRSQ